MKVVFRQYTSTVDLFTGKSEISNSGQCYQNSKTVEDDENENNPREWRRKESVDCANEIASNCKTEECNSDFGEYDWTESAVREFDAAHDLEAKAREKILFTL